MLKRITVAALVHPLLTLSVRMLTSPELISQNWSPLSLSSSSFCSPPLLFISYLLPILPLCRLSAYWTLITTQGVSVLYTGLKISLMIGVIPFQKPFYLLGIPETVLYRRMSGEVCLSYSSFRTDLLTGAHRGKMMGWVGLILSCTMP
jgi:hypothetical protein